MWPLGQDTHWSILNAPFVDKYVPVGQGIQDVAATSLPYVPTLQGIQLFWLHGISSRMWFLILCLTKADRE